MTEVGASGDHYFIAAGSEQRGPFAVGQLLAEGVSPETLVWRQGMPAWQAAGKVDELAGLFIAYAGPPPLPRVAIPVPYATDLMPANVQTTKILAGVMGIVLGGWGVHRFILGDVGGGILRILITICTCGMGAIIGLIEGVIYLTKTDEEFYHTYMVDRRGWF